MAFKWCPNTILPKTPKEEAEIYVKTAPQSFTDIHATHPCQARDKNRRDFTARKEQG